MKIFSQFARIAASVAVVSAIVSAAGGASVASAASPAVPPRSTVSGAQAKAPFEPGTRDAQKTSPVGPTNLVKTDSDGGQPVTPLVGNVSGVDFQAPLNYCSRGLTYTPVRNTTSVTKSIQVRFYNDGGYKDYYTTVAANSTAYPAFYRTEGTYGAYLYVSNGSGYQYDEYKSGNNTCRVSVTRTYNTGGWVQLKIQNTGTAYATQQSTELAPYPASGTYTGTHYDYPVAGGAAIYRWFSVGTSPYGIVSTTVGSYNAPYLFSGDL